MAHPHLNHTFAETWVHVRAWLLSLSVMLWFILLKPKNRWHVSLFPPETSYCQNFTYFLSPQLNSGQRSYEVSHLASLSAKFCLKPQLYVRYMRSSLVLLFAKCFVWNRRQITISDPAVCGKLEEPFVLSWCTKLLKGSPCLMLLYM